MSLSKRVHKIAPIPCNQSRVITVIKQGSAIIHTAHQCLYRIIFLLQRVVVIAINIECVQSFVEPLTEGKKTPRLELLTEIILTVEHTIVFMLVRQIWQFAFPV